MKAANPRPVYIPENAIKRKSCLCLGRMCKAKVKGFGLRTLLIRMGSFKTQPSILPGQPNYETILLGEVQEVSFDVLFTPLGDLSACL